jgi:ATP/maltotriose-dependent transcriptional regulator MalT
MKLAQMQQSTGDLERCSATLLEAIELVPGDDTALRLRLTSACAACENFLGRHEPAERRLVATAKLLPEGSREAVVALLDLATGAFFTLEFERMCDMARRGLAAARALGEPALVGAAAAVLAHGSANAGLVAEASASADEAGARLDELPDDTLALHLDTVSRLAWAEYLIERFDDSIRHAARGVAVARATGQGQFAQLILTAQALSTAARGDLSAATALQEEAIETAELAANDYMTSGVLTASANIAVAAGDIDRSRRAAERSVDCVANVEGGHLAAMARVRLAVTLRELGASAADTEELVAAAGGWELPRITGGWRVQYLEALTRVEVDGGHVKEAAAFATLAETTAAGLGLPLAGALARRARARALLADGQGAEAAALALVSAADADRAGAPIEAARSRVLAGRALSAAGDRAQAIALLRAAERELDERGALRDRADARRELRRLGARTEPRGPAGGDSGGLDSLSRREREVAILVTERKTNKEVADELFLSEKTIESHLRNIFAKLGAGSRVDVARAVERSQR